MNLNYLTLGHVESCDFKPSGMPERANPCRCIEGSVVDARDRDCITCMRCGRHPARELDDSWQL